MSMTAKLIALFRNAACYPIEIHVRIASYRRVILQKLCAISVIAFFYIVSLFLFVLFCIFLFTLPPLFFLYLFILSIFSVITHITLLLLLLSYYISLYTWVCLKSNDHC